MTPLPRPFVFLTDLPWWTGLPIFLAGAALVVYWYIIGVMISLFGAWTFSKLLARGELNGIGFALTGLPLFFATMLIPAKFSIEVPVFDLLNHLSATATYATRSALGLATAFIAFQSFR